MRVVDKATGKPLMEHQMGAGDIFRACQTKDESIKDWVGLAVKRGRATGSPAIFWLDKDRAHDANMIGKVNTYLKDHDLTVYRGINVEHTAPDIACQLCGSIRVL